MMANTISAAAKPAAKRKESAAMAVLKRLKRNKTAMFGLIVFVLLTLSAIFAPLLTPYGYATMNLKSAFQGPSAAHWFGTDDLGRDILTRILYGGRYSLTIGIISIVFALFLGVIIGTIAGYFGGMVDNLIMRFLDIFQSIPGLLLTIAISAALGSGFDKTILALSISRVPSFARVLRASIMRVRDQEYLEAAESIGCGRMRMIMKYVLPNSLAPLIVEATMGVANTVLTAASLSYIGLGVQPPTPEWGAMLSGAKGYIRDYSYMLTFPGLFIALTVLCLNMLGDGLRDALDPRLKN